jgi:hypothetical protein
MRTAYTQGISIECHINEQIMTTQMQFDTPNHEFQAKPNNIVKLYPLLIHSGTANS